MNVRAGFTPTPSIERSAATRIDVADAAPDGTDAVGCFVGTTGALPPEVALDRAALAAAGFEGRPGETLVVPGSPVIAVGAGDVSALDAAAVRDAAAAFALAATGRARLAVRLPEATQLSPEVSAQAVVEGVLLARYHYPTFKRTPATSVEELTVIALPAALDGARAGVDRGRVFTRATELARDLANTPPAYLTATRMAEVAVALGADRGLGVEVFDRAALVELGCGGLLGVNAGSTEEPRMIKLTYEPANPTARLTLVGKGIMYDSGGISLKPSDDSHASMKNDMSGAGAVLSAMSELRDLGCTTAVVGYLMCTDNMPSGTATALGDILTIRGGTTVEVMNSDAEGRLVMADALVLATEEPTDAIVNIATLTGACLRALGTEIAGVMGNNQALIDQIGAAGAATDEPVWQLPLERRYRKQIDSDIADMKNIGGPNAGAITAALFLEEFVAGHPWAHIDIAGTAQSDVARSWHPRGTTGFGARLLIELALAFTAPRG